MEQTNGMKQEDNHNMIVSFLKKIGSKITSLFTPEEVEVTFKVEGKKISYTYTKVEHKQVA